MLLSGVALWGLACLWAAAPPPSAEPDDQQAIVRQLKHAARRRAPRARLSRDHAQRKPRGRDGVKLPALRHPTVHTRNTPHTRATVGWSANANLARFSDRRRRYHPTVPTPAFGHLLETGTRFVFDVFIAGNPAGTAEAYVGETRPDPRGAPPAGRPLTKIVGRATTGGLVSMLATVSDEMVSWVDAQTGAPVLNTNVITRTGLMAPYKRRETVAVYEGRGQVRLVDTRDRKTRKVTKRLPEDTLDALSAMAWVRSLDLALGERATVHALDGGALMRIDVINRGQRPLRPMPSIGTALNIRQADLTLLEGTVTRVSRHKVPIPGKRVASFRSWVSNDDRRIILALESDMWLGVIRIVLSRYDPPRHPQPTEQPSAPSSASND
ncbi:MAG: DUF3108 domain-containing protein [Nannocystaceae bacterium]